MKITTTECVDCDLPCIFEACRYYKVERHVCDECMTEIELYHFEGREMCAECILETLEPVEGSFR